MSQNFWKIGFFIILPLFIIILVVFTYTVGLRGLPKSGQIQETTPTSVPTSTPTIPPPPISPVVSPKSEVPAGWKTYQNLTYKYKISYPEGASVSYADDTCVNITYRFGGISIKAPNTEAICGRTGAGYELSYYSENVKVGDKTYTAKVMVEKGPGEILKYHNETANFTTSNGFRIEYGAGPDEVATYNDYLADTKPVLLKILAILTFTE